jgi:CRISPR-associated protein Csh1
MQDKAIAAIGEWQLQKNEGLEPVDLYIENMFPGKDYQMLLLVFEITNNNGDLQCEYKGIDIEKVRADKKDYHKYAYRKGSARGGDVTFTTKISSPVSKKINGIKETTFKNIIAHNKGKHSDTGYFQLLRNCFVDNETMIIAEIDEQFKNFSKDETVSTGLSLKIIEKGIAKYLREFGLIKEMIILSGSTSNYIHAGTESKSNNKLSSVSGNSSKEVYGFAAPFKYSSPDKTGFISGFFNKRLNWRNYPISSEETLTLEIGRKYVLQNLTGYFYGYEYMTVPHPIIKTQTQDLNRIINLLKTAFSDEKQAKKEKKKRAEDRVQRLIAKEKNYFNLDILFFKEDKKTGSITIKLMLEEILPSRFRKLFIDAPENINKNPLFKNAFTIKNEKHDLSFNYQIIKGFFEKDILDIVKKLFLGKK